MKKYQCSTCGKITENKKDICGSKDEISSFYVCGNCSKKSTDYDAICNPVEMKPAFYCGTCGNGSTKKKALCDPVSV